MGKQPAAASAKNQPPPSPAAPAAQGVSPNGVRAALSTKEGWRQFVKSGLKKPAMPTIGEYKALPDDQRILFNDMRFAYHRSTRLVRHHQLENTNFAIDTVINGGHADDGAGVAFAVTGVAGSGKTTMVSHWARDYERKQRKIYPEKFTGEVMRLPVCFSALLPDVGLKGAMEKILRFYGEPVTRSDKGEDLRERLVTVMRQCGTEVLILDQAQNLRPGNKLEDKVARSLKHVMDDSRVVMMLVGIDLDKRGPIAPSASGTNPDRDQLAQRTHIVKVRSLDAGEEQWKALLSTLEGTLLLYKRQPGDLSEALAGQIWERTKGRIGITCNLVNLAANVAIMSGSERILPSTLDLVPRTAANAAELADTP